MRQCRGSHNGPSVSAQVCGSRGLGTKPGLGHYVVFLGKTLSSYSAPLNLRV